MKKFVVVSFFLCCLLIFSTFTYGMERPMNLRDITNMLVRDSHELQTIDLNYRLETIRYKQVQEDYEELKERIETISPFYGSLYMHEVNSLKSLEAVVLLGVQAERRKKQAIEKAKYDLQKEYLNLVILQEQKQLLEGKIIYLDRQISIERVKVDLNLSTKLTVYDLEAKRANSIHNVLLIENTIEHSKQVLKTKLGIGVEKELDLVYEIPLGQVLIVDYDLSKVLEEFDKHNLELETLRNNVTVQKQINKMLPIIYDNMNIISMDPKSEEKNEDAYKAAVLQLEEEELKLTKLEKNYELMIKDIYYQYNRNIQNIYFHTDNKKLAEEKLKQMEGLYKGGIVSQQQLDMEKQVAEEALLEYNKALIDFINSRSEVELIRKGINPISNRI